MAMRETAVEVVDSGHAQLSRKDVVNLVANNCEEGCHHQDEK
jgi:hypothetical protein